MKAHCPKCSKEYTIDERYSGKKVKCTSCETIFQIPEFVDTAHPVAESNVEQEIKESHQDIQTNNKDTQRDFSSKNLKPEYFSFLFFGYPIIYFLGLGNIILYIASVFFLEVLFIAVGVTILIIISFFLISIIYKKELYHLERDHISFDFGGIFSDNSMELKYNKITQVTLHQRFLERIFFHTGTISIGNAGSSQSFIKIKNIKDSKKYYEEIQDIMRSNGFSLKKENIVQTEKPHWLGVLGEATIGVIVIIYISVYLLPVAVIYLILKYLDLKNRVYEIYDDCIVYNEGFLDYRFSVIPMEAISDAENKQSFFSRLFGLHDVIISSEGSNNKVHFSNMVNGEKLAKNILYLKKNYYFLPDTDSLTKDSQSQNEIVYNLDYDREFKAEYKPHILRSIIGGSLKNIFTHYRVEENSVSSKFDFFKTETTTFTTDKVSKIIFHENIIDMLMGTCSVEFDSIGSSRALVFRFIKKTDTLYNDLLGKVGIYKNTTAEELEINFNFLNYCKSHIFLVVLVIPFIFLLILYPYYLFYYSKRFYSVQFYEKFIEKKSGIIFQKMEYTSFNNIKNIYALKSPLTTNGYIDFIVGGDSGGQVDQVNTHILQGLGLTNSIKISYLDDCFSQVDILESKIVGRNLELEIISQYSQDYRNSLVAPILLLLIPNIVLAVIIDVFFIYFLMIPLGIIGLIIYYTKSVQYIVMKEKVLKVYGIVFSSKKSMLFHRINMLEKNQGFLGKIFSNGSIKVFSKGSSHAELNMLNINDYNALYEDLNKHTS